MSKICLHVQDMIRNGYRIVRVHTVDNDVIVIGLAMFQMISGWH